MLRDAWNFLIPTGLVSASLLGVYALTDSSAAAAGGGVFLVLTAFIAYFFRDPDRLPPDEEGAVVASGDGRVVQLVDVDGSEGASAKQISVFLSIFDVHVNRIPVSGRVTGVEYRPGRFRLAFVPKASSDNEQTVIQIETPAGAVVVKQIAGLVARRIICHLSPDDVVSTGDRFGWIRFGSRVDHILPPGSDVRVSVGDRVRAGETVIGVLPR